MGRRGRAMRALLVLALVVLVGCGGRPDPWGHRLTEEERVAWGRPCGSRYSHSRDADSASYTFKSTSSEEADTECGLTWDVKNNRLFQAHVDVGSPLLQTTPPSADQIEPYIRMVEQLLPPDEQRIARKVATGSFQYVRTKNFQINGGYGTGVLETSWSLTVVLRWDR